MRVTTVKKVCFILGVILPLSLSVHAGLLSSSETGSTVTYTDIYESISGSGTYGNPFVSGNSIDFNPLGLGVLANDANSGSDFNDANLSFFVEAHNGHIISSLQFTEAGDYFLSGLGNHAGVTATFVVNIYEVDGVVLDSPVSDSFIYEFGDFTRPADPLVGLWSGTANLNIEGILVDHEESFINGATHISINLDNLMYADAAAGTYSSLKKKDATGFSITAIPEPGTATLLGGGSLFLISFRRKFSGLRHGRRSRTCGSYTRMIINHLLGRSIL